MESMDWHEGLRALAKKYPETEAIQRFVAHNLRRKNISARQCAENLESAARAERNDPFRLWPDDVSL